MEYFLHLTAVRSFLPSGTRLINQPKQLNHTYPPTHPCYSSFPQFLRGRNCKAFVIRGKMEETKGGFRDAARSAPSRHGGAVSEACL